MKLFQENLLLPPHHPSNVGGAPQQHSAASFPDGSPLHPQSMQKMQGAAGGGVALGGTSGALTDLLGLESECANIQAGIRQIDQIGSNPVAMAALQNPGISGFNSGAEMIPIGSLQPSSNHFPVGSQQQQMNTSSLPVSNTSHPGQHKPHHPQAIMNSGGVTSKQDLFGATPFLPPPPSKV